MKYFIPNTNGLFIDDEYEISNSDDRLIFNRANTDVDLMQRSCLQTEIFLQGQLRKVDVKWLYLYARHQMPKYIDVDHITFIQLPKFRAGFPYRAVFSQPYYFNETYRIVPMCPTVAVNTHGSVIDLTTGKICQPWKEEYLMIAVMNSWYGPRKSLRVHLLVANAWIIENQDQLHPVCNHLDGNKYNPVCSNLEWVSFSENSYHAIENGWLKTKSCRLRNKETGEILHFASVQQAAQFLKRLPEHLYASLKLTNTLLNDIYEFRIEGDTRPWLYETDGIIMNDKSARYIIQVDEPEVTRIFNGAQSFAYHYGLIWTENPLSLKIYVARFKRMYPEYTLSITDQSITKPIEVYNNFTGEVDEFDSVNEIAEQFDMSKQKVRYAIGTQGRRSYNGYRFRYKSDEQWPDDRNKYDRMPIHIRHKNTQDIQSFNSLSEASRTLDISVKILQRMLNNPNDSDSYLVYRQLEESSETSRKT